MKSKKAILKRFKITKKKKLLHRLPNQNHFNAKESGNKKRKKHKLTSITKTEIKNLKKFTKI